MYILSKKNFLSVLAHYKDFQEEIHRIFPLILDTKHIATGLIRKVYDPCYLCFSKSMHITVWLTSTLKYYYHILVDHYWTL